MCVDIILVVMPNGDKEIQIQKRTVLQVYKIVVETYGAYNGTKYKQFKL